MITHHSRTGAALAMALLVASVAGGCAGPRAVPSETSTPPASTPGSGSAAPAEATAAPLPAGLDNLQLRLKRVWTGFGRPVYLTHAGDGSGRVFVVEQGGLIRVIDNGRVLAKPYLDLRSNTVAYGERGLLGMAFSPNFRTDGEVYVDYTDTKGDTVVARYTAGDPSSSAPSWSAPQRLLYIDQPYANHNGGCLQFGPDGYLYVGMGDGGASGDPGNRAQDRTELLGKILRIDVSRASGAKAYSIPSTNPSMLTANARVRPAPEVWARGLRNPWRFSFDASSGALWVADVGQDAWEEVNRVTPAQAAARARQGGLNFGWRKYEGLHAYPSGAPVSNARPEFVWPVLDYPHPTGESVTGGYVYRGTDYPALIGTYLYADYVDGWIGGVRFEAPDGSPLPAPETRTLLSTPHNPSSFGEDERGELYLVAHGGDIYRVTAAAK